MKQTKLIRTIFLLSMTLTVISSCEKDKGEEADNSIELEDIIGEWNTLSDFMVFASDYSYNIYLKDNNLLQAGHYSYDKKTNTISAVNAFDQTTTTITVNRDQDLLTFKFKYYSPSLKKQCEANNVGIFTKKKSNITTVFDYLFLGSKCVMYETTSYNIIGPGEVLTNLKNEYYFNFTNNYLGSFTKHSTYTKIANADKYYGFDFNYVYWKGKLYLLGFSDNNSYSSPYKSLCNNGYIKIVSFNVDNHGKVSKWSYKEIEENKL